MQTKNYAVVVLNTQDISSINVFTAITEDEAKAKLLEITNKVIEQLKTKFGVNAKIAEHFYEDKYCRVVEMYDIETEDTEYFTTKLFESTSNINTTDIDLIY